MAMPSKPQQWDIFCTVVDNFGDIGVTWRLARQLVEEFDLQVRLLVDDLASFAPICPELDPALPRQTCQGVDILFWPEVFPSDWQAGEVVIEAFACELPAQVKLSMSQRQTPPLWINLEYLSAESWIDECHGLPSLQANGLTKYFFFPGFTPRSGGLICERSLLSERKQWQADPGNRQHLFAKLGLPPQPEQTRYLSLFTYESDALPALLEHWRHEATPTCCLIPKGRTLTPLLPWLGRGSLQPGEHWQAGSLTIHILPMTSQREYDRLLWSCDFNFVRGEDSFLRAQWAARPFLWHIYPQEQEAHLEKLSAFLARYGEKLSASCHQALLALSLAYDAGEGAAAVSAWLALQEHGEELSRHSQLWPEERLTGGDLASRLVQFCEKQLK
ncbi:MAG: elongation factor P maturation arginine rhamnosyltransferase EarP [Aeromonadaceae bacterium]